MIDFEPERPEETPLVKARVYCITHDPKDHPGKYVVRKHLAFVNGTRPAELIGLSDALDEARKLIPEGLIRIPRDDNDDKVIVESWI